MDKLPITIAIEGLHDQHVIGTLLQSLEIPLGNVYGMQGKDDLDKQIARYNEAAKISPWMVVRDLDQDATCAAELRKSLLPNPVPGMFFRIAVRAVEAWLLADRDRASSYFQIPKNKIPLDPETLQDPKRDLVQLVKKHARNPMKKDMVPPLGYTVKVGPGYTFRVIEYATRKWRPSVAAEHSESLRRCIMRLEQWKKLAE